MSYAYPVWLFFAAFFFYYAYANWRLSEAEVRPFSIRSRGDDALGPALDPALVEANAEFVRDFNANLAKANKATRGRYRATAVGYGVSGLIALLSMFLLLAGAG
jgi:hypothetical protein